MNETRAPLQNRVDGLFSNVDKMQDLTQETTEQTLDLKFSMMSDTPSQRVEQTVFRFLDAKVEQSVQKPSYSFSSIVPGRCWGFCLP